MKPSLKISKAEFAALVLDNPYLPHEPTIKQAEFLVYTGRECMFGGAAGGGKSDSLLMSSLMYVSEKDYSALILRRTYADLSLPGAIMDRAGEWLRTTDAQWHDKSKTWIFPSGATLTFGYLETENDKYRYQGAEFQCICFDELTQFSETQYQYLFSRLRKLEGSEIPLRIRAASNPGGLGHKWVRERFIIGSAEDRLFIPAKLSDNPYLDQEQYAESLKALDPVTRAQLEDGNWDIAATGEMFKREWIDIVDQAPQCTRYIRRWDCAATEARKGKDPDYTVGVLMGILNGVYYVIDVQRFQKPPGEADEIMKQQAVIDGKSVSIREEQEPGSAGKKIISIHSRGIFEGYDYRGEPSTGDKVTRARPFSAACQNGNVKLVRGPWNNMYLWELEMFPNDGVHDDQVDASSGAFNELSTVKNTISVAGMFQTTSRRL